jgi:tetratricopeptide (TPR) repeat protein
MFFFGKFYIPSALNNLGKVFQSQKKYAQAEAYYKRSLNMAESALDKHNVGVAIVLENMAKLYRETNRPQAAQDLSERALQIRKKLNN